MSDNVVSHPHRDLMAEAKRERKVADSPEAQALQADIYKAVNPYSEFLEREGVIWEFGVREPDFPRMKARALVITLDYGRYCGLDTCIFGPLGLSPGPSSGSSATRAINMAISSLVNDCGFLVASTSRS
jgi:hypothetical protein